MSIILTLTTICCSITLSEPIVIETQHGMETKLFFYLFNFCCGNNALGKIVVISSCFAHNRVRNRVVIGVNIKIYISVCDMRGCYQIVSYNACSCFHIKPVFH